MAGKKASRADTGTVARPDLHSKCPTKTPNVSYPHHLATPNISSLLGRALFRLKKTTGVRIMCPQKGLFWGYLVGETCGPKFSSEGSKCQEMHTIIKSKKK